MLPLQDPFARRFHYLRLSVTDVCNFRCTYCLPDGYRPDGRNAFLGLAELRRVAMAFVAMGTRKIRLTGGEPSLRRDFDDIVASLAELPGLEKLAMTTNGYRLKQRAARWRAAGLTHLNVSIDSLDPRMFHQITGENRLAEVMAGLEAALAAGFASIKVNTVLLRHLNDRELDDFLAWIRPLPIQLRLIELMQTGDMDERFSRHHVSGEPIKARLLRAGWQLQPRAVDDGPAQVLRHADSQGEVGLIMPYSKDFCASCNRLRVSALGKLHLCLFGEGGVALRELLQSDADQPALMRRIRLALEEKRETHFLHQGNTGATPHLASIGG